MAVAVAEDMGHHRSGAGLARAWVRVGLANIGATIHRQCGLRSHHRRSAELRARHGDRLVEIHGPVRANLKRGRLTDPHRLPAGHHRRRGHHLILSRRTRIECETWRHRQRGDHKPSRRTRYCHTCHRRVANLREEWFGKRTTGAAKKEMSGGRVVATAQGSNTDQQR